MLTYAPSTRLIGFWSNPRGGREGGVVQRVGTVLCRCQVVAVPEDGVRNGG